MILCSLIDYCLSTLSFTMECCLLQNKLTKPLECNQFAIFDHVVANCPVLRSVINDFFSKEDVDRVVPPQCHDVARTPGTSNSSSSSSYLCRKYCFACRQQSKKPDSPIGLQGITGF